MKYKIFYGFAVFVFVVSMTPAQTKLTSSGKCGKPDVQQNIAAGDQIGHLFTLASGKCATNGEVGGAASKEGVFSDTEKFQETTLKSRVCSWKRLTAGTRFSTPTKPLGR